MVKLPWLVVTSALSAIRTVIDLGCHFRENLVIFAPELRHAAISRGTPVSGNGMAFFARVIHK